jgi:hypothetical protein
MNLHRSLFVVAHLCLASLAYGQLEIELPAAMESQPIRAVNRTLSLFPDSPGAVELNAAQGDGLAILEDVIFDGGAIEIELLGENAPGRSFIGVAFNIQGDETYEAIYFRPFNFEATEQIRRDHMVQYIYHPEYTWFKLREERTGEFENEIPSPPGPDDWFKATIVVLDKHVEVYVDDSSEPVLKVERLSSVSRGKIGLWVGNGSSGRFRKLVLE